MGEMGESLEFLTEIMQQCWREDPQSRPTPSSIIQMFLKSF